jgi:hypothetical protein
MTSIVRPRTVRAGLVAGCVVTLVTIVAMCFACRVPHGVWIAETRTDLVPAPREVSDPGFFDRYGWMPRTHGDRREFLGFIRVRPGSFDALISRTPGARRLLTAELALHATEQVKDADGRLVRWYEIERL